MKILTTPICKLDKFIASRRNVFIVPLVHKAIHKRYQVKTADVACDLDRLANNTIVSVADCLDGNYLVTYVALDTPNAIFDSYLDALCYVSDNYSDMLKAIKNQEVVF